MLTVQRMLEIGRVGALAIAPSGSHLVLEIARLDHARAKLVPQLWRCGLEDGALSQLTRGEHGCFAPAFREGGELLFLSERPCASYVGRDADEGDGSRAQVWCLPESGEAYPLTDEPLGVSAFRAQGDGTLVVKTDVLPNVAHEDQRRAALDRRKNGPSALHYRAMPARQWDHWYDAAAPHLVRVAPFGRLDLTPRADRELREVMLPSAHGWTLSRDGATVITEWSELGPDRIFDVALVAIDTRTGELRRLAAAPRAMMTHPVLSDDGERLAFCRHVRSPDRYGKVELCVREAGEIRVLAAAWDRWPTPHAIDRERVIVTADDHMQVPVFSVDLRTDEVTRVTVGDGCHDHVLLHPNKRSIVGLRHALTHPPEPFQAPLEKPIEPFVIARASGAPPADFVEISSHETRVEGESVEWLLVRPRRAEPAPVLFWIHGGPVAQFANGWHWRWSPLVFATAGYAVVLPNPRGSTGRGQAFVEGIWGNVWGETCFRDLMSVADDVAKLETVRGDVMAAMGGSFGGYMANYIGGKTTRFRAIVTHASLWHLEQFGQTTDIPAWFELELGVAPPHGRDELDKHSPHRALDQWKTPALVIHGEKDYRVPIHEALALFEGLQRHGVDSELLVFPDENHWIAKPRNVVAWYDAILAFLARTMR